MVRIVVVVVVVVESMRIVSVGGLLSIVGNILRSL